jgi:hypothetical protein
MIDRAHTLTMELAKRACGHEGIKPARDHRCAKQRT